MTREETRYVVTIPTRKGTVYVDVQKRWQKKYRIIFAFNGVVQEMGVMRNLDIAILVAKELANEYKEVWVK